MTDQKSCQVYAQLSHFVALPTEAELPKTSRHAQSISFVRLQARVVSEQFLFGKLAANVDDDPLAVVHV